MQMRSAMRLISGAILLVFVTADRALPQGQVGNIQPKSDTALLQTGMELMKNNRLTEAQLAFETLIRLYPHSLLEPDAFFALGESFQSQPGKENLLLAEDQFRNFVIFFPQNPKAPDAQFKIISILMGQMKASTEASDAKRALLEVNKFLAMFPASQARYQLIPYQQELVLKLVEMAAPISGCVQDSNGKPIANVKVTLIYRTTKAVLSTAYSDEEGNFEIPANALTKEISEFGIQFEKEGFRVSELNGSNIYAKSAKVTLYTPAEYDCLIADFYFRNSNPVAASYRYQEAIKLQTELRAANDGLGRSLELMSQYDQAIKVYQDFISKFPNSLAVPEFRARISDIQNKKR